MSPTMNWRLATQLLSPWFSVTQDLVMVYIMKNDYLKQTWSDDKLDSFKEGQR